jgi:hypothetical protein
MLGRLTRRITGSVVARVAINVRPASSPWGGGNQGLQQMRRYPTERGYEVVFDLKRSVDAIVLVDPRVGRLVQFGTEEIQECKATWPEVLCLHRVNECDARKGTNCMDELLAGANKVADYIVTQQSCGSMSTDCDVQRHALAQRAADNLFRGALRRDPAS